jgi:DNA polymerase elongation subunit (family B)
MDFSDNFNQLKEKNNNLSEYTNEYLQELLLEAEDIQQQYKNLQLVVKANANSLYGVSASIYYSLHDVDIAEDICGTGKHFGVIVDRAINKFFVNWGEKELKIIQEFYSQVVKLRKFTEYVPDSKNDLCVYGDTDSRYIDLGKIYTFLLTDESGISIKFPDNDKELSDFGIFLVNKFINSIIKITIEEDCKYRNGKIGHLRMTHEVTTRKCAFIKKKKYIMSVIWKDGLFLDSPKITFKGVELRRGSSAPRAKKILSKLVDKYLLENYDLAQLRIECIKLINYIKQRKEKDFIYLITSVSNLKEITKNLDTNIWSSNKNHIQMQIAMSWLNFIEENKLHGQYKPAFNGQKMNYYYCLEESSNIKVIGVPDDVDINKVPNLPEPDWNRMINATLIKPLLRYISPKQNITDTDIEHFLLGVKQYDFGTKN